MQHIHAKHGIASAIISMLRSLTLSDWAFFFEFQQNSRTATRMARARPQTSTTKTPPGTGKTGSSLFYRRRLSLLLLALPAHASRLMYLSLNFTQDPNAHLSPSNTSFTPLHALSTPVYLSIYLSICLASRLYHVIYLYVFSPRQPSLSHPLFSSPLNPIQWKFEKRKKKKKRKRKKKIGKEAIIIIIEWKGEKLWQRDRKISHITSNTCND